MFAHHPLFLEHGQHQAVGLERFFVFVVYDTGDAHFAIFDEGAAVLAGAKTLRLQDAVQG